MPGRLCDTTEGPPAQEPPARGSGLDPLTSGVRRGVGGRRRIPPCRGRDGAVVGDVEAVPAFPVPANCWSTPGVVQIGSRTAVFAAGANRHRVPSSVDFVDAVRVGWGRGMVPDLQAGDDVGAGRLVELAPDDAVEVVLHWQRWRVGTPVLERVSAALTQYAGAVLMPVPG